MKYVIIPLWRILKVCSLYSLFTIMAIPVLIGGILWHWSIKWAIGQIRDIKDDLGVWDDNTWYLPDELKDKNKIFSTPINYIINKPISKQ